MRRRWIAIAVFAPLGIVLVSFIGGELVKLLWNWLLPVLFGWPVITFWQAFGLLALSRILFGGPTLMGSAGGSMRGRMAERWAGMTPEERERMRQAFREKWGWVPRSRTE